jgi:DNA repair and recombination protein RAD52
MSFTDEQKKLLAAKLHPDAIKPAKAFGPKGDYIEGWHAIAEANRIFGFDGWSYDLVNCTCVCQGERAIGREKKPGHGVTYVVRVRVRCADVEREDVGAGHGYDVDLGLAHESAVKEAVTDALKRALRTFGNPFGLALYDKDRENVGFDFDWKGEHREIERLLSGCKDLADLADLFGSARVQSFVKNAPGEYRGEIITIKDKRKAELAPKAQEVA